jgi:signal transduction histidine kinase
MSPPTRWKLSVRITTLCAAVAVLLGLIATGAAVAAVNNRRQLDNVFNRIIPLRNDGDALLTAVLNEETGIRGYALNGRPADLKPYTDGMAQQAALEARMAPLLADLAAPRAALHDVQAQIASWRSSVAQTVIDRVGAGDQAGAQAVIDDTARARFDKVRGSIAALQKLILDIRNAAVDQLKTNSSQIVKFLIAAGLVVILAGILLAVLLRYLVTRPVHRLAQEVRQVVGGDYEHVVDNSGPPEVAALGRGVEEMRRKIVSELAEVRAARQLIEETNQQLELQADELTRSNRDLEQFAYVASHDLQEPLRKVASFCQLLQRRYAGKLDERGDQYIAFAVDGAQRMQRLINDLLAFSRIGRINSDFTDVDLNAVVSAAVSQSEATLAEAGGSITWSGLPTVRGEDALLTALIGNLVGNSLKFRRPDVPPQVHFSARETDGEWEISCQDNGIGIEPEFADKVFVIFQRLHAKDAYPGTGIGLAISKKIVEYHGGRVWIDTSVTGGTTVRFTLPVSVLPQPEPESEPEQALGAQPEPEQAKETVA